MFGIGAGEFILILIVGLIVFGPSKLPEIGRSVGKMLREFRKAQAALSATLNEVEEPIKNSTSTTQSKPPEKIQSSNETSTIKNDESSNKNSIEEVTEMINSNPISVPQSKVNISKEVGDK
ncbi:MAG: twin-arginine translocase TatA/TatE family subunit [Selenomonadaceae bacterium]|nr:twin-arginine translocase TatA/TatE family subunit [Selenomonadaceae bacterium]